uniref:Uncharacterized protein TCIL3000_3_3580 n=1 Tax=Trypanosoma congolense (strain IL3000) TaxID=1068625 RepID=G0UKL8_TRYCI|nr:unnamed protein product [Trypanosoma congolense IL3000]
MVEATELAKDISHRLGNGTYECSICSEPIRLRDRLWTCAMCFGVLHLPCVKNWVHVFIEERKKSDASHPAPTSSSTPVDEFRCPLCQSSAPVSSASVYKCFCGKTTEPPADPSLLQGSCGEMCEKHHRDDHCSHHCTLMCHPGPCPPCQLTRVQSCFCGKSDKIVGCSSGAQAFECDEVCGKLLDCEKHFCGVLCHEGPCPVCTRSSVSRCFCGAEEKTRYCTDSKPYSCGKPCSKPLNCGKHLCLSLCHKGECQPCTRDPERVAFCPCGNAPLTELLKSPRKSCLDPIPSCGAVCGAQLPCGHTCRALCHENPSCKPCTEIVSMRCCCGSRVCEFYCFCTYLPSIEWKKAASAAGVTKEKFPASFPPKCAKGCKKQLSCGKHTCNEECCTKEDHTCYKICTKRLSCGKHSCGQLCHKGPCPPCSVASYERLYCRCRCTWAEPPVSCGTTPPTCNFPCTIPRPCGHPPNHTCHFEGECPVCVVPVEKKCNSHGKTHPYHLPCYRQSVSCGKKCGKLLSCCGTQCGKICHPGKCEHQCNMSYPALA